MLLKEHLKTSQLLCPAARWGAQCCSRTPLHSALASCSHLRSSCRHFLTIIHHASARVGGLWSRDYLPNTFCSTMRTHQSCGIGGNIVKRNHECVEAVTMTSWSAMYLELGDHNMFQVQARMRRHPRAGEHAAEQRHRRLPRLRRVQGHHQPHRRHYAHTTGARVRQHHPLQGRAFCSLHVCVYCTCLCVFCCNIQGRLVDPPSNY